MQLDGKTAFITGGAGGIGGGIAEALAEKGAKVILADIDLGLAQAQAEQFGKAGMAVALDVTSLASWAAAKEVAVARFGPIDILCNNAGIATPYQPLLETSPDAFSKVMAVNVAGVYNGVITFAQDMCDRGCGHIVNTSSMNGLIPHASFAAYSASKFAVLGLSDALRGELAPFGVGVSTLFPGLTRSRMSLASNAEAAAADERVAAKIEAGMMEPVWLGRAVARAIEHDEPYIITHPGYLDMIDERHARIRAAHGDPAQPGYTASSGATRLAE